MSDKTFNIVFALLSIGLVLGIIFIPIKSEVDTKQEQEQVQVMIDKENETICYYTSQWGQCLWVDVSK